MIAQYFDYTTYHYIVYFKIVKMVNFMCILP